MIASYFPFTLDATGFLIFYSLLLMVCVAIGIVIRIKFHSSGELSEKQIQKVADSLSPSQIGYLTNGPRGAIDVAIVSLCLQKKLRVANRKFTASSRYAESSPQSDSLLQQAILSSASADSSLLKIRKSCSLAISLIRRELVKAGLLMTAVKSLCCRIAIVLTMLTPLLIGGIRISNGHRGNEPVGYLILLVLISVFSLFALLIFSRKSQLGIRVRRLLRKSTPRPRRTAIERAGLSKQKDRDSFDRAAIASLAVFGIAQADAALERGDSIDILRKDLRESTCFGDNIWVSTGQGGDGGGNSGCGGGGCGGCGGCGG